MILLRLAGDVVHCDFESFEQNGVKRLLFIRRVENC